MQEILVGHHPAVGVPGFPPLGHAGLTVSIRCQWSAQGHVTASGGPGRFAFVGPFLHPKKNKQRVFLDRVDVKTNATQG